MGIQQCTSLRHAPELTDYNSSSLSGLPVIVEEDDPYAEAVRVISDAIKRQAKRNARNGHEMLESKAKAFESHEKAHAGHFSGKLAELDSKLQETEEKVEATEKQIDEERLRHAKAKEHIAEKVQEELSALQEEEEKAIEQQHRAESTIQAAEAELHKEEAEVESARQHHKEAIREANKEEKEIQKLVEKEKQKELEDEEAADAREESAEGNRKAKIGVSSSKHHLGPAFCSELVEEMYKGIRYWLQQHANVSCLATCESILEVAREISGQRGAAADTFFSNTTCSALVVTPLKFLPANS
ncbi:hypothetical protein cyc_08320 [Cyclospora cayetanensis]|uniref:Uncharacterized protein n=1 Tax=Cyclospora cayetanensis TaxID=88456 RepID=A0A1D3D7M5_9EIME|nr:hypothetical protein cyc_08320 [Cyclospora cayetanensis]